MAEQRDVNIQSINQASDSANRQTNDTIVLASVISGKKKLCLREALDLLQNLLSEINDVLTDDFSDEKVPANYLLEFSLDS
ncbi:hypothetical protein TNCV_2117371 [Trichonephila clavipes]|nr:hypothetical protein TNCV_2117371 [Trichonephila clavipes]